MCKKPNHPQGTTPACRIALSAGLSLLLLGAPAVHAHFPALGDGSAISPETAISWDDPQISRVVYQELSPATPQLWITFEVDGPQTLLVQLGVPLLERLRTYRPSLALLGPDLPEIELPFAIPDGLGGRVFESPPEGTPEEFYERFSGTTSWIWVDEHVTLPAAGRYYLVAYHPTGEAGKVWVASGEQEVFAVTDLPFLVEILDDIRRFHELPADVAPPCFLLPAAAGLAGWAFAGGRRRGLPRSGCSAVR